MIDRHRLHGRRADVEVASPEAAGVLRNFEAVLAPERCQPRGGVVEDRHRHRGAERVGDAGDVQEGADEGRRQLRVLVDEQVGAPVTGDVEQVFGHRRGQRLAEHAREDECGTLGTRELAGPGQDGAAERSLGSAVHPGGDGFDTGSVHQGECLRSGGPPDVVPAVTEGAGQLEHGNDMAVAGRRREQDLHPVGCRAHDVEPLADLATGGDRATVVPLDVGHPGVLDQAHHLGQVVQDEVEVDRRVEPLVEVADPGAGVQADDEPPAGEQRPREGGKGVGQLGRGQVDEGVPREDGRPARAVRRPHQPAQVADLVVPVREPPPRLLDHSRREIDAESVGPGLGEVRRDVTGTAADLDHRAAVGVRGDPVEQPAFERLARAARRPGGRRTPLRRRRTTNAPAGRGPRRPRRAPPRGPPGTPPRRPGSRSPGCRRAGATTGCRAGRAAGAAREPVARDGRPGRRGPPRPRRGRRSRAADRYGSSARRVPAHRAAAARSPAPSPRRSAPGPRRAAGGTSGCAGPCRPTPRAPAAGP